MDGTCSCIIQKPGFPTAKTIYFAPSTVLNGTAPKTTVIRVPIASFNPTVDTSAPSAVLSKKLCKLDTAQCNGPATTFSYAEMGSGGQVRGFFFEKTPVYFLVQCFLSRRCRLKMRSSFHSNKQQLFAGVVSGRIFHVLSSICGRSGTDQPKLKNASVLSTGTLLQ